MPSRGRLAFCQPLDGLLEIDRKNIYIFTYTNKTMKKGDMADTAHVPVKILGFWQYFSIILIYNEPLD